MLNFIPETVDMSRIRNAASHIENMDRCDADARAEWNAGKFRESMCSWSLARQYEALSVMYSVKWNTEDHVKAQDAHRLYSDMFNRWFHCERK